MAFARTEPKTEGPKIEEREASEDEPTASKRSADTADDEERPAKKAKGKGKASAIKKPANPL